MRAGWVCSHVYPACLRGARQKSPHAVRLPAGRLFQLGQAGPLGAHQHVDADLFLGLAARVGLLLLRRSGFYRSRCVFRHVGLLLAWRRADRSVSPPEARRRCPGTCHAFVRSDSSNPVPLPLRQKSSEMSQKKASAFDPNRIFDGPKC